MEGTNAAKSNAQQEGLIKKYSIKLMSTSMVKTLFPCLQSSDFFFFLKVHIFNDQFCNLNCLIGCMDGDPIALYRYHDVSGITSKAVGRSQDYREGKKEDKKNRK